MLQAQLFNIFMRPPQPPRARPVLLRLPLRIALGCLHWLLALVILFEEWGWGPLQRALARIGQLPGLRWLVQRIGALPPYAALAVFIVPSAFLLPIKFLALWLIGRGMVMTGMTVVILAKLVGTAVVARLFTLTQPALMTLPWFAQLYTRWIGWKTRLLIQVRTSWLWMQAHQMRERMRAQWQAWKAR